MFDVGRSAAGGGFRELFEVHFGRFDAKLEQRIAEVKAELRQEMSAMKADLGQRISALEIGVKEQMAHLETRLIRWGIGLWIAALLAITAVVRLSG